MTKDVDIGILIVADDARGHVLPRDIIDIALVLEQNIVLQELTDIPNAYAVMIGLLYALNIDYPRNLKYTFEVLQKVILNMGGGSCSARVHGLRNKLLQQKL